MSRKKKGNRGKNRKGIKKAKLGEKLYILAKKLVPNLHGNMRHSASHRELEEIDKLIREYEEDL